MKCVNKLGAALVGAALAIGSSPALAADISGAWAGWQCSTSDTYQCSDTHYGPEDDVALFVFAADPTTGSNAAEYDYPYWNEVLYSNLEYYSDFGGGPGAYHYWTFVDVPQGDGCPGWVVVAFEDGSTRPLQAWWYYNDSDSSGCKAYEGISSDTSGFMNPFTF
jgi:hypothetical protein